MTVRLPVVGGPEPVEAVVEPREVGERERVPWASIFVVHSAGDYAAKSIAGGILAELREVGVGASLVEANADLLPLSIGEPLNFKSSTRFIDRFEGDSAFEGRELVLGVGHALPAFWKPSITVGVAPEWSRAEWAPSTRAVSDRIDLLMPRLRPGLLGRVGKMILAR